MLVGPQYQLGSAKPRSIKPSEWASMSEAQADQAYQNYRRSVELVFRLEQDYRSQVWFQPVPELVKALYRQAQSNYHAGQVRVAAGVMERAASEASTWAHTTAVAGQDFIRGVEVGLSPTGIPMAADALQSGAEAASEFSQRVQDDIGEQTSSLKKLLWAGLIVGGVIGAAYLLRSVADVRESFSLDGVQPFPKRMTRNSRKKLSGFTGGYYLRVDGKKG